MFLSVNGTSQSYGWEPKDQASFRNAGAGGTSVSNASVRV
jgi:hypothetical protein